MLQPRVTTRFTWRFDALVINRVTYLFSFGYGHIFCRVTQTLQTVLHVNYQ